jgi:hypothetical protein
MAKRPVWGLTQRTVACAVLLACRRAEQDEGPPGRSAPAVERAAPAVSRPAGTVRSDSPAARPEAAPLDSAFAFASRIGVAQFTRDGAYCLAVPDRDLGAGTPVLLVSPGRPRRIDTAWVAAPRQEPCTTFGDESGSADVEGAVFYVLRLAAGARPGSPSIGLTGLVAPLVVRDSAVVGDLDGDGHEERFAECASREGTHLSVVTPTEAGAARRWHAYFFRPLQSARRLGSSRSNRR